MLRGVTNTCASGLDFYLTHELTMFDYHQRGVSFYYCRFSPTAESK